VQRALHEHTDTPACLEGTRVQLLDSIKQWMSDPTGKQVYWLTGVAGTGKTTIAQSVAEIAKKLDIFGASFLFSHASEDRRDYRRVIPTLAYQLARDPRLRPGVVAAVNADNAIAMTSTSIQAQHLLFDVLQRLSSSPPSFMLIVLDALDECNQDPQKMHGGDLIPILIAGLKRVPFVKVFLTSRPEPSIEAMFVDGDLHSQSRTLALHRNIEEKTIQSDIDHYLHTELNKLQRRVPNNPDFPSEADIRTLVERANTLFIYARTTVEYISDPKGQPDRRLAALIKAKPERTKGQFGRLDDLYSQILRTAHDASSQAENVNAKLRAVLVTLVLVQQQLPADELAVIAGVDDDQCREYLRHISALINYQHETNDVVRLMHLSFPDFLSNPLRCFKLSGYVVNLESDHLRIVEHCLEQMNHLLRYDVCHIGDPSLLNAEVADLKDRLTRYISEALRYACRFWVTHWLEHIRAAGSRSKVPSAIEDFCSEHLLHWIEVLSLTGDLYSLQPVMLDLMLAMNVRSFSLGPCLDLDIENDEQSHSEWKALSFHKLLTDAHFLMRDYQTPISLSALHVYHGGVTSMPECLLKKKAAGRRNARLVSEHEQGWQTGTTILEGHTDSVMSVAFSSDNSRIVSGSSDHTVRIWDAVSGAVLHALDGHTSSVYSVAFSSDGSHIVSGSGDRTVRIWDAVSGAVLHTLEDHIETVYSVAFASDGLRIVSGSGDKTVRIWDAVSGAVLHTLYGHINPVMSVAFSSDGSHIVSGSHDHTVRIWDAVSGTVLHTLDGHTSSVYSVAFSSNGSHIVSGSDDRTVRIWDAVSGAVLHILDGHTSSVYSVAFSSDGSHIVSGSGDRTVRIWDAVSGAVLHILDGHTSSVYSVAFSSDGSRIVSGSDDCTVRIWDAVSGAVLHTLYGHTGLVRSVDFSPDGSRIGSGSYDDTVRIWDAVSGTVLHTLDGHTHWVNSVAFSSDGSHIVSGSHDRTVRIWDAFSGAVLHSLGGYDLRSELQSFLVDLPLCKGQYTVKSMFSSSITCAYLSTDIRISQLERNIQFKLDGDDEGWVFRRKGDGTWRRMCWLPHKRRHRGNLDYHGDRLVIGASNGCVTILDFSDV
jgi:WD40 repeat protein